MKITDKSYMVSRGHETKVRRVWESCTGQQCVRIGSVYHKIERFLSPGPQRPCKGGTRAVTHKVTEVYHEPSKPVYRAPWTSDQAKATAAAKAKLRAALTDQEIMDLFRRQYGNFQKLSVTDFL
jgi:hypothetical protein